MVKKTVWIGGGLGWVLGGPIGALVGAILGSFVDITDKQQPSNKTHEGDFFISLLLLSASVMKADGKVVKSELSVVKKFFSARFTEEQTLEYLQILKNVLNENYDVYAVCRQIKQHMNQSLKLELVHFLLEIAYSDNEIHPSEHSIIQNIAYALGISAADTNSLFAMFSSKNESDYTILEIDASASNEEIKKAYRKMARKFHPDLVAGMGKAVEEDAKKKFQRLQQAYENIKKQRGFV